MPSTTGSKYFILIITVLILGFCQILCTGLKQKTQSFIVQKDEPAFVWLEAENGRLEMPMVIGKDDKVENILYVHQPATKDHRNRLKGPKGTISLDFEAPSPGQYTLWARVYYIDIDGNSFYCKLNDQEKTMLGNDLLPLEEWHWIKGDSWKLEKGQHTIQLQAREDGARIDQILLTTAADFIMETAELQTSNISSPNSDILLKRAIITEKDSLHFAVLPPTGYPIDDNDLRLTISLKDSSGQCLSRINGEFLREYTTNAHSLSKGMYSIEAEILDSGNQSISQLKIAFWIVPSLERFRKKMSENDMIKSSLPTIEEWIHELDKGIRRGKSEIMKWSEKTYRAIEKLDQSQNPFEGMTGWITKAYISSIDDTRQPYLVHIPTDYEPQKKYPVAIYLHGVRRDARHFRYMLEELSGIDASSIRNLILVSLDGRGTHFYDHIAEEDLFSVLREVKQAYSVDEDRICLWGQSMGGYATYSLACKHPHLWAALAPSAGGTVDTWLENILHIPIHIYHGEKDHLVPVHLAYSAYNRLKSVGAEVNLTVYSGAGHQSDEIAVKNPDFWQYFMKQKRLKNPKRVVYNTHTLRHNRAYWLSIDAFQKYDSDSLTRVEAEIQDRHTIAISTTNVAEFSLFLDDDLVDVINPVTLVVNGNSMKKQIDKEGCIPVSVSPYPDQGLVKRHGISGPFGDQFYDRFIIVYGTKNNEAENRKTALQFASWQNSWASYDMTHVVKSDKNVTQKDIQTCHLILVGMPDDNSVLDRIISRLPVQITSQFLQVGVCRFEGANLGIRMIYPNPLNPKKYVVIHCGSQANILQARPDWLSMPIYKKHPEILIVDKNEQPMFAGYFNEKWQLDTKE